MKAFKHIIESLVDRKTEEIKSYCKDMSDYDVIVQANWWFMEELAFKQKYKNYRRKKARIAKNNHRMFLGEQMRRGLMMRRDYANKLINEAKKNGAYREIDWICKTELSQKGIKEESTMSHTGKKHAGKQNKNNQFISKN